MILHIDRINITTNFVQINNNHSHEERQCFCLQQPWAQQILIDLVITINAYFASEISWAEKIDQLV